MRLFYFENQSGSRIPLNNEDGIFLSKPQGLGVEFDDEYGESGNGFFFKTKSSSSQLQPDFTLVFDPAKCRPYEKYRELVDWIFSAEDLYFVYCPYGRNEFYRKIEIGKIDKTELDKYGSLQCETSVLPLTPWYLPAPLNVSFGDESEEAMMYDFEYTDDLVYAVGSRDYSAEINIFAHVPSAVKITFKGQAVNPSFILMGLVSRKVLGECKISGAYMDDDTLVLSTVEQDSYVKHIDKHGVETDLIDDIDITTNPFFRVPTNEPCELIISGESLLGTAEMQVHAYYRGV